MCVPSSPFSRDYSGLCSRGWWEEEVHHSLEHKLGHSPLFDLGAEEASWMRGEVSSKKLGEEDAFLSKLLRVLSKMESLRHVKPN